jgi:thiaminase (transcriptional activator TenA)
MRLSARLWHDNQDLARAAREHPFVQGIGGGTLPTANFSAFVAQDAYFLDAFARAYALGLAHAPDRDGLFQFAQLLNGVLDELKLHNTYAARWGIDLPEVVPMPATLAYTNFLLETAALQSVGETCAAMTPCMRLYAFLGQSLIAAGISTDNPYTEWVQTYAASEFDALAQTLERMLDAYAGEEQARDPYRRAMQLELAFFDAFAGGLR